MTFPNDPPRSSDEEIIVGDPLLAPPVPADAFDPPVVATEVGPAPAATPVTPVEAVTPAEVSVPAEEDAERGSSGGKVKVAAVLAGAAALANKVRQDGPKKVQELRNKRTAGRHVILTEIDGRTVAVGPFPDDTTARASVSKVMGETRIVELVSEGSFFSPEEVDADS